jgi:hypothetical protein
MIAAVDSILASHPFPRLRVEGQGRARHSRSPAWQLVAYMRIARGEPGVNGGKEEVTTRMGARVVN